MKKSLNNRAILAGAVTSGLTAAGHSATVQITLTGNQVNYAGANNLNADVTGDMLADITISGVMSRIGSTSTHRYVSVVINGGLVYGGQNNGTRRSAPNDHVFAPFFVPAAINYSILSGAREVLNAITFTDPRINGGATTSGYLGVNSNHYNNNPLLRLTRVVFDDANVARPTLVPNASTIYPEFVPVPEVSSLGLLALGAGGLLLRRKRKKSA